MANSINISSKQSGDSLTAGELMEIVDKTNAAITEHNQVKAKVDNIEQGATADQSGAEIKAAYEAEADTNAFTDAEKSKLEGVEAGANNYEHPASHSLDVITETDDKKVLTAAEREKLAGIEEGATVGGGGAATSVVEWVTGEAKPTTGATKDIGAFIEGYKHLVSVYALADESTLAVIQQYNAESSQAITEWPSHDGLFEILFQSDGKIILCAESADDQLIRLNTDLSIDDTFSSGLPTTAATPLGNSFVLDDDSIIVFSNYDLYKLSPDGALDTTFSANLPDVVFGLGQCAILSDGKIVTATDTCVVVINTDGTLFATYSHIDATDYAIDRIHVDSANNFYTVSMTNNDVKKYSSAGLLDTSFSLSPSTSMLMGISAITATHLFTVEADMSYIVSLHKYSIVDGSEDVTYVDPVASLNLNFGNQEFAGVLEAVDTGDLYVCVDRAGGNSTLQKIDASGSTIGDVILTVAGYILITVNQSLIYSIHADSSVLHVYDMDGNDFTITSNIPYYESIFQPKIIGNAGDMLIINADGNYSKLVAPSVASTLKHTGVADSLPFWEADA